MRLLKEVNPPSFRAHPASSNFGIECQSYKSRALRALRRRFGVRQRGGVRGSLDQIVTGSARERLSDDEIIVFDSTGVATEDVAAAALVYERAENTGAGFVVA